MLPTTMSISEFLAQRKQSFFMYKGIPYDITEMYEDEGKFFLVGVSDDCEEATEEIFMPFSQGTDRSAN